PSIAKDDLKLPDAHFIFPSVILIFDHGEGNLYLLINQLIEDSQDKAAAKARAKMNEILKKLEKDPPIFPELFPDNVFLKEPDEGSNFSQNKFEKVVERIKEYIRAGDVYQVNISQRFKIPFSADTFALYLKLRKINPSPFGGFLDFGSYQLVSSSPERLITLRNGVAETRPIAGTRRRGEGILEDEALSSDLILNPKERAEHIMLVDLERNDLGRVSSYGTVRVNELMTLEKYSHVIHIVSNIKGKLHEGKDQLDLIKAMFPGGTVTGCPKVRCMEIIEELEPDRRGPYTGSMGYFGFNGNMDMNIIIRTFVIKEGNAYVQVGAGIVYDSQPSQEYFETLSKAEALLKAVGINLRRVEWEKLSM
ncbi:MAG: anthranilate synthase component I family protein, partial [Candidatus Subteraquimicrobiales bacterium]|nr:anthranilate synthase component I family protein [Candidatus Subteraquimicrobiales bacterium]